MGFVDIGSSAKIAVQIKGYHEDSIEPPLTELEMAVCEYIQSNLTFPIFKNYIPEEYSEEGSWESILITTDFEELEKFLKENHKALKNYRVIHSHISCRRDKYKFAGKI